MPDIKIVTVHQRFADSDVEIMWSNGNITRHKTPLDSITANLIDDFIAEVKYG